MRDSGNRDGGEGGRRKRGTRRKIKTKKDKTTRAIDGGGDRGRGERHFWG